MKIVDQMKNWTFTEMGSNPKLQVLIERAMWLEQELSKFLKTANCRLSREIIQVCIW